MFKKWFTRIRAVKRCLDQVWVWVSDFSMSKAVGITLLGQVISRRTLANMTGKRYALLVAPGDHWVHWPDRRSIWIGFAHFKADDENNESHHEPETKFSAIGHVIAQAGLM